LVGRFLLNDQILVGGGAGMYFVLNVDSAALIFYWSAGFVSQASCVCAILQHN
jgi:hypothetical protein